MPAGRDIFSPYGGGGDFGFDGGYIPGGVTTPGYYDAAGKWHSPQIGSSPGGGFPTFPSGTGNAATTTGTIEGAHPIGTGATGPLGLSSSTSPSASALGKYDWATIAKTGVGLAGSLFAPEGANVKGALQDATDASKALGVTGQKLTASGADALGPVLHYLAAVTSGDPQALMDATQPERRRVIDQYDTAKQAVQFSPRSGGTASAMVDLNAKEASDLSGVGAKARTDAMKQASDIGTALTSAGVQTEAASAAHLTNLLYPMIQQNAQDERSTFNTFAQVASLIGLLAM